LRAGFGLHSSGIAERFSGVLKGAVAVLHVYVSQQLYIYSMAIDVSTPMQKITNSSYFPSTCRVAVCGGWAHSLY
jgi:hypothetical protein